MIVDIINKKRLGKELSYKELEWFFNKYLEGEIADYQMSSLLMAICINGMTDEEVFALTKIFIDSGDVLDFSDIPGIKVDKHSTGGIGDKTTLVICPIVASLGIPIIKMSGKGLGYTGGTIDKLKSIPGFQTTLSEKQFIKQIHEIGIAITSQNANLAPMDKVIYALRDVTGTVESIPLVASSVMSKKIAGGADKILIDIKVGKGAFMKNRESAKKLSDLMIKIGEVYHREVRCIISDMDVPLGTCIGNSLEVMEAIDVLKGKEQNNNFVDLCIELATEMVSMGKEISMEEAKKLVIDSIDSGLAYKKFLELVHYQNGKITDLKASEHVIEINSLKSGTIKKIDALEIGKLALKLGSGRENKNDRINYTVGIKLNKLVNDKVKTGDVLMTLYTSSVIPDVNINNIFTFEEKNV